MNLNKNPSDTPKRLPVASCQNCWKPTALCLCEGLPTASSRLRLLVLQHPQEARKPLGTARLLSLTLKGVTHKVGFSWPSLAKALGASPRGKWAVLYVGPLKDAKGFDEEKTFQILGKPKIDPSQLEGIVILDGNWKQAKTLWWRNPWLRRLPRAVLNSKRSSEYGDLRRQPRKYCLSTIEAAAETLAELDEPEPALQLRQAFARMLEKARA